MARPRKHAPPMDASTIVAKRSLLTTMFHATDPRWYSTPTQTVTVGLPEPSSGLEPPVTPPVTIEGSGGGLITCVNAGPMYMYPRFVITGPCTNPKISNLSLPGAPSVSFGISLNPGDTLSIDMDWESVILVTAGSTVGSSRRSTKRAGSTWFAFPQESTSTVEFTTEDTSPVAATLTAEWACARMGL
jgi:hypothetical protein